MVDQDLHYNTFSEELTSIPFFGRIKFHLSDFQMELRIAINKKRKQDTKNDRTSKTSELRELRAQIQNLQLEVDILKEMLDVLKKPAPTGTP